MQSFLFSTAIPAGLFTIMFGMGLQLSRTDWLRIRTEPKGVVAGLTGQFVLMPALVLATAIIAPLPEAIAVGFIILAACPGGTISNSFSYLSRADVALSVTLTAISSVLAIATLPLIIGVGLGLIGAEATGDLQLPIDRTIKQLVILTLAPLGLGMLVRKFFPSFARQADRAFRAINVIVLATLFGAVVVTQFNFLRANMLVAGTTSLVLSASCLFAGYGIARLLGLPAIQRKTVAIETGVQNGAVGIMIATVVLQQPAYAIAPTVYGTLNIMVTAVFIALAFRSR